MKSIFNVLSFAVKFTIFAILAALAITLLKAPVVFGVVLISGAMIVFLKVASIFSFLTGIVLGSFLNIFRKDTEEEVAADVSEVQELFKKAS